MEGSLSIYQISRLLFHTSDFHNATNAEQLYQHLDESLFELLGRSSFTILLSDKASVTLKIGFSNLQPPPAPNWSMSLDDPLIDQLLTCFETKQSTLLEKSEISLQLPFSVEYAALLRSEGSLFGFAIIHEGIDLNIHEPFSASEILTPLFRHFTKAYSDSQARDAIERQFGDTTGKLLAINEVAELLGQLDLETLLPKVMSLALHLASGEVGNLMIGQEGKLQTKVEWGLQDADVRSICDETNTPIVEGVFKNQTVFVSHDLTTDPRIRLQSQSHDIHSIVSVPLYTKTKQLGVLNLVNTGRGNAFLSENVSTLQTVARLASTAIENAILHHEAVQRKVFEEQLRIARQIWENIMPQSVPELPNATIAARSIPATVVGGDFYDFIEAGENRIAIVIADVSGKGIPAAMMMNTVKSVLRIEATRNPAPYDVVNNVNKLVIQSAKMEGFITLTYIMVDLGQKRLFINNAGHNPTIIYRKSQNKCERISSESIPLAISHEQEFQCSETDFNPGDCVILYTDGITEARNPEKKMFETDGLCGLLEKVGGSPTAEEILNNIYDCVRDFSAGANQHDDMTVVALKFNDA